MATLLNPPDFSVSKVVCQECGRKKLKDLRPAHLLGFQTGELDPEICLINQGYLCVGSSTRGGCRGPSDILIDKDSHAWLESIQRVFESLTDVPAEELREALVSPQLALFLFQFSDYSAPGKAPRPKEKIL